MPYYVFRCDQCGKDFELHLHMDELDKTPVRCPHCGSEKAHQEVAAFSAVTSKKS